MAIGLGAGSNSTGSIGPAIVRPEAALWKVSRLLGDFLDGVPKRAGPATVFGYPSWLLWDERSGYLSFGVAVGVEETSATLRDFDGVPKFATVGVPCEVLGLAFTGVAVVEPVLDLFHHTFAKGFAVLGMLEPSEVLGRVPLFTGVP